MTTMLPPPPPFDPELGAALGVLAEQMPPTLTAEMIAMMRSGIALATVTDEELAGTAGSTSRNVRCPGPTAIPTSRC
jgi:hypothetical protein